jgi:signal transduction histidine kinase
MSRSSTTKMMKTEARLALTLRQRRFEWALARDEQARTAARLVAGKTHDLLNLLQIVRLAGGQLAEHCNEESRVILDDLQRSADDARRSLGELMAVARAAEKRVRGAPVCEAVKAVIAELRGAIEIAIEARIDAPRDAATRCTAEELEHLVIGLVLDADDAMAAAAAGAAARAGDARAGMTVELEVRERVIAGVPWIELVRSCKVVPDGDRFELRVVEAIAERAGGELATSERRGGGEEVIVALPRVA